MKPSLPPLPIGTPCPKRWEDLTGSATKRFCEECRLHVHNLSAMRPRERERFVAESGGHLCIAYDLRADGSMVTPSRWTWMLKPLQRVRWKAVALWATAFSFLLSGCTTRRVMGRTKSSCETDHAGQPERRYFNSVMGVPFRQHDPKSSDQ